jgi:hypothetical protein
MTKRILTTAFLTVSGLLALPNTADAGPRSYQAANCTISLQTEDGTWRQINNECFLGTDLNTHETAVKMGSAYLLISRFEDNPTVAGLYTVSGDGKRAFAGTAIAKGACWVAPTIRFCAP